jgi:hypothetical protein
VAVISSSGRDRAQLLSFGSVERPADGLKLVILILAHGELSNLAARAVRPPPIRLAPIRFGLAARITIGYGLFSPATRLWKRDCMRKRKTSKSMVATPRELDKLIEEATVDSYNEEEQASGFFTMIDENLALPFATQVLGVEVSVVAVEMDNDGSLKAVCERGGNRQRIGLTDLPLPSSSPSGAEWIAAYRRWLHGR